MAAHAPEWSPTIEVSFVPTDHGRLAVVRDDLLRGGTKQRAAVPYLQSLCDQGIREFVYASPFSGFAQIALAVSCEAVDASCTVFAEWDHNTMAASHFTQTITSIATVHLAVSLSAAESRSFHYVRRRPSSYKIPLGFNDPLYKSCLRSVLQSQWSILCDKLSYVPRRLWLPVGSGTLAETFHGIISPQTTLTCVDVRVLPSDDNRICQIKKLPNLEYFTAPQAFTQPASYRPPINSNLFYDAKLWQFVAKLAGPEDVWWNVAA